MGTQASLDHRRFLLFKPGESEVSQKRKSGFSQEHPIRNHFFCALRAFSKLQTLCFKGVIQNCYEISRQLFVPVIRQFILEHLTEATFD